MVTNSLHLEADKLEKSKLSIVDDIGTVYIGDKYIYRAINTTYIPHVKELLESGLIQELTLNGLFPKTEISNQHIDGYELVLQHEKISRVIYPFEWSPEMLRKAALCVLDVNECANKYGYELKDAHPFNVIFKYNKPLYIDFGSIVKQRYEDSWRAKKEFINCYINHLLLVEGGYLSLYKRAFHFNGSGFDGLDLLRVNNKIYNFLGLSLSKKIEKFICYYQASKQISRPSIVSKIKYSIVGNIINFFLRSNILPFRKNSIKSLRKKVNSINLSHNSPWKNYHKNANYWGDNGHIKLSPRLEWVVEQVQSLSIKTVIELAGNEGVLSYQMSKLPSIKEVICTDYDESTVDQLLENINNEKIYAACFDFLGNVQEILSSNRSKRLQSDIVIALAVTHHLILTQKYDIDYIFSTLLKYTKKYIIIEFMPLGLWDGESAPELPMWYTEEWFSAHMKKYFNIITIQQLEQNRIAYIGELIEPDKLITGT